MEFARELTSHIQRWCAAEKVINFDDLCEMIILEQFKNTLPQRSALYISVQRPSTAVKAAELADA